MPGNNAHPLFHHDLAGNALSVYVRGYSIIWWLFTPPACKTSVHVGCIIIWTGQSNLWKQTTCCNASLIRLLEMVFIKTVHHKKYLYWSVLILSFPFTLVTFWPDKHTVMRQWFCTECWLLIDRDLCKHYWYKLPTVWDVGSLNAY